MTDTTRRRPLRSAAWFGAQDKNGFMYRSWMKNQGIPDHEFEGKPIIGICNTWSELTPCNAHLRKIAEHVKRGVSEAGGFPVEFPVFSNGESNLRPTAMLTRNLASMDVEESIRGNAAIGGSTNAVIHLKAIAGRIGVPLELEDWTRIGTGTPTVVDLQPSGRFLMEEFYNAGGLPGVLRRLGDAGLLPHKDALTVNGKPIWDNVRDAPIHNDEVIRPLRKPLVADGSMCILRGNLAPRGAVLKPSAATPALMQHRGKAVVFEDFDHYKARIADPDLDVDANSVMVLKNCGPKGYPGRAEVGNMGLPPKLLAQGITDMVRISDARMSGTAYGTVVLHVAPEAAAGGPLAIVRDGDWIVLDCKAGRLDLEIGGDEIARCLAEWQARPSGKFKSGYQQLYIDRVLQADEGCDFDFLVGCRGSEVPKHSH